MQVDQKVGNYRWRVVALLFFATTINYIDRQIIGLLKPFISGDIGMDEASYGYVVSAFQAAYAIGLLAVGGIIDRFGTRISYAVAVVVWSLAGCLHAAARGVVGFGIARFFLGLGEAANFPAAIKATAEWFPKKERALATGIFNTGSNAGALIAPVIVSGLTVALGWRWAFIITGLLGFVWVVAWLVWYRIPAQARGLKPAEMAYIHQDDAHETDVAAQKMSWKELLRKRNTLGICVARFSTDWVWWFFLFWTPDFLFKAHGVDIKEMVAPLMVIYLFAGVGSVTGGYLSSWLIRKGRSITFARKAAMLIFACCVVPIALIPSLGLWASVCLIGLAAFAHQGWASNVFTIVSDNYPKSAVGSMTGLAGFAASIGGILASVAVGQVLQLTGSYLLIFAVASLAYLVAWSALRMTVFSKKTI